MGCRAFGRRGRDDNSDWLKTRNIYSYSQNMKEMKEGHLYYILLEKSLLMEEVREIDQGQRGGIQLVLI